MLSAPADDKAQSVMLLPAWPCSWDVRFKIHASKKTTITGELLGGQISFAVDPPSRKADVKAMPCQR